MNQEGTIISTSKNNIYSHLFKKWNPGTEKSRLPLELWNDTNNIEVGRFGFNILSTSSNQGENEEILTPYHEDFDDQSMVDGESVASSINQSMDNDCHMSTTAKRKFPPKS